MTRSLKHCVTGFMRKRAETPKRCRLCDRRVELTFHHLIPRKVHRRTYFRKHVDKRTLNAGIWICRLCHKGIHKRFDEIALAKHFNSLELLRSDESLRRHFAWVAKQKA